MSEYGVGLSLGDIAEIDKERIMHALNGELVVDETEQGFVYDKFSKDECDAFIVSRLEAWYYRAKEAADAGRAMERVAANNGLRFENHMGEFMQEMKKAGMEYNDFLYEDDLRELHDEADEILKG